MIPKLSASEKAVNFPADGTAKDDARYISPYIGLPGYRHSVGIAR